MRFAQAVPIAPGAKPKCSAIGRALSGPVDRARAPNPSSPVFTLRGFGLRGVILLGFGLLGFGLRGFGLRGFGLPGFELRCVALRLAVLHLFIRGIGVAPAAQDRHQQSCYRIEQGHRNQQEEKRGAEALNEQEQRHAAGQPRIDRAR